MDEPKPFASLSSGLLARKGQARPAMRSPAFGDPAGGQDDLGWNDMGHDAGKPPRQPEPPVVLRQQAEIAQEFGEEEADGGEGAADTEEDRLAALEAGLVSLQRADGRGKAAFTLRLDADRHLKLRLACALKNRSAQQIVTEALDAFLETMPNLESLAGAAGPLDGAKRGVGK